jgi:multiple sugar transport system ATP-binding protein
VARVVLEHLSKLFPGANGAAVRAVDDLNLKVEEQELLVVVGPSGCGKTTTLRLIAGLETPSSGRILLDGETAERLEPKQRDVAMVFQNHALYPHLSVYENMAFGLAVRKAPRAEIEQRVREASEMLGLREHLARLPMELSGGERQRVALGRALVRRPRLFLFDEPLSNLDTQTRLRMRAEIARLHAQLGWTSIYVTHDQDEALNLGRRIAVLKNGALQQMDEPLRIYREPANVFVAGFFGSPPMNLFEGVLVQDGGGLAFQETPRSGQEPPLRLSLEPVMATRMADGAGRKVLLGIRPEHVTDQPPPGESATGHIRAVVERLEFRGHDTFVHLRRGDRNLVARLAANSGAHPNHPMDVYFDLSHAHLFDSGSGVRLA